MTQLWRQALFVLALALPVLSNPEKLQDVDSQFFYEVIELKKSIFGEFSMLAQERDDYATTITRLALESAHAAPENAGNMGGVRRLIALALNLSPRNRTAVVANHQLGKGVLPEKKEADYSRTVFARLLLTRGQLLKKQKTGSNYLVGRFFVELAAELDPRNEDAIYDAELQKLDGETVDWASLGKSATEEG